MAKAKNTDQNAVVANMADLALQPNTMPCYTKTESMGSGITRTTFYSSEEKSKPTSRVIA